jgi:methionyl-tRNA formyltransferase
MLNDTAALFEFCKSDQLVQFIKFSSVMNIKEIHDDKGRNLLITAAFHHSYKIVDFLLDSGLSINSVNKNGTTVLMYAKTKVLENRNFSFLQYLINKGANVYLKDRFKKDIFDYINETGDIEMIFFFNNYK